MKESFKVSPRILAHLGEDLIKNEIIALLELVKNSYDAGSKICKVHFHIENDTLVSIEILDNGCGMDREIIENVWLTIGTDNKLKNLNTNQTGRIPLGEKGIGRLGVHKLGSNILLLTKTSTSNLVRVKIDWELLKNAEKIQDFTVDVDEPENATFPYLSGTGIRIKNLKFNWARNQLREAYRSLNSLNSPFQYQNQSDAFQVIITSNRKDLFKGLPTFDEIKEGAMYSGKCTIQGNRITNILYEFTPWPTLIKIEKGRKKETKDFTKEELILVDSTKDHNALNLDDFKIGKIDFEVLIFEKDTQLFGYVTTEKTSITEYLKSNSGIRVYRNGMRVYNYGEPEDDWLGLNQKRVSQVGGRISNNIVIGAVMLDRLSSFDLKEKTNREGFVENSAYSVFVDVINYALSLIVKERNCDKNTLSTLYKKSKNIEPVLGDLEEVITLVENNVKEEETREQILTYLYRINTQYQEVKTILLKSANAGLNFSIVIHELDKVMVSLVRALKNKNIDDATNYSKMLENIIQGFSIMLKNSKISFGQLSLIVEQALKNYQFRFKDHKIKIISNYESCKLKSNFALAEAISVLTNLLDNSIYWLSYDVNRDNRIISIQISDELPTYQSIIVMDNGPGFNMPPEIAKQPFITGKPHNIGSGLGLHVANEMMHAMKGDILFLDPQDVEIPKEFGEFKTGAIIALCFRSDK